MSNKLKNFQEFGLHLTSLFHELRDANDHFYFVNCLYQALTDYEREIQHSPAFWGKTIDAHVSATLSHLCRVYDDHPAAVHLLFLLETVRDNPDIFCKTAFKQRLGQIEGCDDLVDYFGEPDKCKVEEYISFCRATDPNPLVEKLREWRHNVVAHLNKRVSTDIESFKQEWPLEQKDIQELISKGHDILEKCAGWYKAQSLSLNLPSPYNNDYKFVFESMRRNLSKRDEQSDLLLELISKHNTTSQSTVTP
jgi:AbiU2